MKVKERQPCGSFTPKIILLLSLLLTVACVSMVTYLLKSSSRAEVPDHVFVDANKIFIKVEETKKTTTTQPPLNPPRPHTLGSFVNVWIDHIGDTDMERVKGILKGKLSAGSLLRASYVLSITNDIVFAMVATKPGWNRTCHNHPVHFQMHILEGHFYIKTHQFRNGKILGPGDQAFIPKKTPHAEGAIGTQTVFSIISISPNMDPAKITNMLMSDECSMDEFPPLHLPKITTNRKPVKQLLPKKWTATLLLHPFSEEQGDEAEKDFPFFQLSYGQISYDYDNQIMLVYVKGCEHGEWWYKIDGSNRTSVSNDSTTWLDVDVGWSFPSRNWIDDEDVYVGYSALNWMDKHARVDWWKKNYQNTSTWGWYDRRNNGVPFRLMFSAHPPTSFKGDPKNLAFFQMFSFSYIINLRPVSTNIQNLRHSVESSSFGFTCGNSNNYALFNWTNHFSASAFMIPVDYPHNPYPTKVYYHWKKEDEYPGNPLYRSQSTIFYNNYNKFEKMETVRADLFGPWNGTHKRHGAGYLMKTSVIDWQTQCDEMLSDGVRIAQQPPWWPILGKGKIMGVIRKPDNANADWKSPLTGSNRTVVIVRMTFPPHEPIYPESTSLWTWYDYTDFITGAGEARPVIFMQSAPKFNLGTSLAQADFFDFNVLKENVFTRTKLYLEDAKKFCPNFTQPTEAVDESIRVRHLFPGI